VVARPDLFEVLDASLGASGDPASVQDNARITASTQQVTAGGIYLQLGAFSAYDNADSFLARMRSQLPSTADLGIVAQNGLYKVHAGPYPDHAVARQAADKIAQTLSIKPIFLKR
jgi:rare lipoprotein A